MKKYWKCPALSASDNDYLSIYSLCEKKLRQRSRMTQAFANAIGPGGGEGQTGEKCEKFYKSTVRKSFSHSIFSLQTTLQTTPLTNNIKFANLA